LRDVLTLILLLALCAFAVDYKHKRERAEAKKHVFPNVRLRSGDFFSVGRYGKTLILETNTERTNEMETQTHEAGKATRFLNGSQDTERS
jgi:hypothetical protein